MVKVLKPLLLAAAMCAVVSGSLTTAHAQHVTLPRETSTPEIEAPKPSSRGRKVAEIIADILLRVACEELGKCPRIVNEPVESTSTEPKEFETRQRPAVLR